MDLLLAGPKANGWQNRVEKTDAPLTSSEAKKPDHQSQKVQDKCTNGLDPPKKAEPIADKDQTGTGYIAATSQPAPPAKRKQAHSAVHNTQRQSRDVQTMDRLQSKNKAEGVPNNIAVSDPNISAGFKV